MTFPDHYLLSFGGTIMSGAEIWSNNIRFWDKTGADASAFIDEESALEHARTNIAALFADTGSRIGASTECRWIKFNRIGPDGRYTSDTESNTLFLDGLDAIKGAASGSPLPPQCAIAVSWHTTNTRGPASRGRIFVPAPHVALLNTAGLQGTMSTGVADLTAATYANFISGLGNWPGVDLTEFVPSVVSSVGTGNAAPITAVSCGTIVDTQRRRRSALVEQRALVAVP